MSKSSSGTRTGSGGTGASCRPPDIKGEIILKRFKDYDYFVYFACGLFISAYLFFIIHFSHILLFFLFLACFIGSLVSGLFVLMSYENQMTFRNISRILVTGTGICLEDRQGKIQYTMPFDSVAVVRYGYREHVISAVLDLDIRTPVFVQFKLTDGKEFTIFMDLIVGNDKKKIFSLLPVHNGWSGNL